MRSINAEEVRCVKNCLDALLTTLSIRVQQQNDECVFRNFIYIVYLSLSFFSFRIYICPEQRRTVMFFKNAPERNNRKETLTT